MHLPLMWQYIVWLAHAGAYAHVYAQRMQTVVHRLLTAELCMPGDMLVRIGEIGTEMYFVEKGTLEVLDKHQSTLCMMNRGCYFGEVKN